jgi:hypothetical protein
MTNSRVSIFETPDDLDVDSFAPKAGPELIRPPLEQLQALTEGGKFRSRESALAPSLPAPRRKPHTYRTGRTATFSVKTTPAAVEAFYAIAEQQCWKAGETFERALAALQRELTGQGT